LQKSKDTSPAQFSITGSQHSFWNLTEFFAVGGGGGGGGY
jgi:hypothetical protein